MTPTKEQLLQIAASAHALATDMAILRPMAEDPAELMDLDSFIEQLYGIEAHLNGLALDAN